MKRKPQSIVSEIGAGDKRLAISRSACRRWRDGLFAIEFYKGDVFLGRQREALAVLRDGVVLGSDNVGGMVEGRLVSSGCGGVQCALLLYRLPPGVALVTGLKAVAEEAVVDVSGLFHGEGDDLVGRCEIGGDEVEIRFRYMGPLPIDGGGSRQGV